MDLTEVLVDGAKNKWKNLLLLDTVASFACKKERSRAECERRRFDQYAALREAVCKVTSEAFISRSFRGVSSFPGDWMLVDFCSPWDSIEVLRAHFLEDSLSKSWEKRRQAADQLLDLSDIKETMSILPMVVAVVGHLYKYHFCGQSGRGPSSPLNPTPCEAMVACEGELAGHCDAVKDTHYLRDERAIHNKCLAFLSFSQSYITAPGI